MTEYPERLQKLGAPTSNHTTLLLNYYIKLKDSSKLNEFISSSPAADSKFKFWFISTSCSRRRATEEPAQVRRCAARPR